MIVYLLINYPNESYSRLKDKIHYDNIQNEVCKKVIKKLYEELEKENEYSNVLDLLDIILAIFNMFKKKKIENDMLRAIIIMNNAFKSGKSTN